MSKVEIKSDMVQYLKRIRDGVMFENEASTILELLQNAQRANATKVFVDTNDDTITVSDDGCGCDDFENLFCSNRSGWNNMDDAFGQGFFSVFAFADNVLVESNNKMVEFNVPNIIETGDLSLDVHKCDTKGKGFTVTLTVHDLNQFVQKIEKAVTTFGQTSDFSVILNGDEIEKYDPAQKIIDSTLHIQGEYKNIKYFIKPSSSAWQRETQWYYDNRFVTDNGGRPYVDLCVKAPIKSLKLRAPERTEFIKNAEYSKLIASISKSIEDMCINIVKNKSNKVVNDYADMISYYLTVEDYMNFLDISECSFNLDDLTADDTIASTDEDVQINHVDMRGCGSVKNVFGSELNEIFANNEDDDVHEKSADFEQKINKYAATHPVAYVDSDSFNKSNLNLIKQLQYDGWLILQAKNELYKNVFEHLGIVSIENANKVSTVKYIFNNDDIATNNELRFMELMDKYVIPYFNLNSNQIRIADIKEQHIFKKMEINEPRIANVYAVYSTSNDCIYLNRKLMNFDVYNPAESGTDGLTIGDMHMINGTSYVLAHELSHMLSATLDDTHEHDCNIEQIMFNYAMSFQNAA